MHDLSDIEADSQGQDRGTEFKLCDPVSGEPTGIKLTIVGPDSATQRRAQLAMADALFEASDDTGRVNAETRERLRLEALAACVVGWECEVDGLALQFTQANVLRLLRASRWVQEQVDAFAIDRAAHRGAV